MRLRPCADEDADAPVITGITDGETYYDDVTFTVTDAHDFTVTVDGQPATAEGSLYTLPADNVSHEIVAVDVAATAPLSRCRCIGPIP